MPVSVEQLIQQLIGQITGSSEGALQFALAPGGTVAAQGIEGTFDHPVDVRQIVADYCNDPSVPYDTRQALQSYVNGQSGPPGPAHNQQEVIQQLQHITYVTNEDNSQVTNIIDQSRDVFNNTDIDVDGDVDGDLDIDVNNASATGDGAAAGNNTGDGDLNQVTGDESQIVTGEGNQANTGDGAVLAGGNIDGPTNTGTFTGVQNDGDISAPVVVGTNTGVVADGDVDDTVVGDHNNTANIDGDFAGNLNFGSGDIHDNDITGSTLTNSAVSGEGPVVNTSGNAVGPGGALSGTGDASGHFEDNDTTTTTTVTETVDIDAHNSIVGTEQGDGDFDQHGSQHADFLPHLEPVRTLSEAGPDGPDGDDGPGE